MGDSEERPARDGAIRQLEAALAAEDASEADYHVKEALQLLDVDAHSNEGR